MTILLKCVNIKLLNSLGGMLVNISQSQVRRLLQKVGFDASFFGYEMLVIALELVIKEPKHLYVDTQDMLYELVIKEYPDFTIINVRRNIERLINEWLANKKTDSEFKERITRNRNGQIGNRVVMCFLRDEFLSQDDI